MRVAGFVLVGGFSSRMGQDKALLFWRSQFLVERVAAAVAAVTEKVTLVGAPERYRALPFSCLPDCRPALGPLGGIETALASGQSEWSLVVGCDMPGIDDTVLRCLLERATQGTALCVAAQDITGQVHPLCAVYHRHCLPVIQKALQENRLKMMKVLEELCAERLPVGIQLANINTPEDWRRWQLSAQ